jgi:hypothetical protein
MPSNTKKNSSEEAGPCFNLKPTSYIHSLIISSYDQSQDLRRLGTVEEKQLKVEKGVTLQMRRHQRSQMRLRLGHKDLDLMAPLIKLAASKPSGRFSVEKLTTCAVCQQKKWLGIFQLR